MNASKRMTIVTASLTVSLHLAACKLTPDMPTGHCEVAYPRMSDVERELGKLEHERELHAKVLREKPDRASIVLKSFLLHYERVVGPLLTDGLLASHGMPAFAQPSSMDEAGAQLKVLELISPMMKATLGTHKAECIEATERHEARAICAEMRRDFESFSRLCSRATELLLRFEAGEWTASGLDPLAKNVLMDLFKRELADKRAAAAVTRVHPELSKFTHFQTAWHYDDFSNQQFSASYREALQRLVLVVSMAGAVAPADCGPIAVQCMR